MSKVDYGLEKMVASIKGLNGVSIKKHDEFDVLKSSMIEYLQEIQGFNFPLDLLNFYSQRNGLFLKWKCKGLEGNVLINSLLGLFSNFLDTSDHTNAFEGILWTKNDYDKSEIKERKQHKVFEFFEGDSPCTTIKYNKDQTYQLFHVDSEIYQIPLSISGYVQIVADLYGFGNFRYYLHEKEFYSEPLRFCPELNNLTKIFPKFNPKSIDFNRYLSIP